MEHRAKLSGDPAAGSPALRPCASCRGRRGVAACGECGGEGWAAAEDAGGSGEGGALPADLAESCGEFLSAWSMVKEFRLRPALFALRVMVDDPTVRWHPLFIAAALAFNGELMRLETESDAAEAKASRERASRDRMRGGGGAGRR